MHGRHAPSYAAGWISHCGNRRRREHGQRTQDSGYFPRKLYGLGRGEEETCRLLVATMASAVDQRPKRAGSLRVLRLAAKEPCSNGEQGPPAQLQPYSLCFTPRKRLQQRQPRVFKVRQLAACDAATEQLPRNCAEARFTPRRLVRVQLLETLPPPGHTNRAERRLRRGRDHIGKSEIEVPERCEGRPDD